ncbi:Tm-1-like ATP-binding domain-containing protein [Actinoplanes bogorensis]|uniref:Tm-1-like ATP-binding domain-containing protein n=1 Tax=Paractinoplanes bogorensis TaxID=1610840 RepID=A0ABS5YJP8_9ACTN|nr:Tm-1-like ATP-binding domain-containing protein [Actinoplanes bogorensis]MBU2663622.1 Tm-1-like ATP-binding domain-containing protein [Actinoplanes bogorensis]
MTVPRIAVLATLDTKGAEARYLADRIAAAGSDPVLVDTALSTPVTDKGAAMTDAAERAYGEISSGGFAAAVALGGGQGSWIASHAFRRLPVGFPRLLVTTAGRDAGQFTRYSDMFSVFSITDIAGLNPLLTKVLDNAALAVHGLAGARSVAAQNDRLVAMTVYGITSAGAAIAREALGEAGWTAVSFHANGVGGPTMEAQLETTTFGAVLDWSPTEIADDVAGGVCAAGPGRLTTAGRLGLPQLVVPGGLDVVNFAAPETLPARFRGRRTYAHTPDATLLRTDVAENQAIAEVLADRLNAARGPVAVLVPALGFSALSGPGGPLNDPGADAAFTDRLRAKLRDDIAVEVAEADINDPAFARHAAQRLLALRNPDGTY